MKPKISIIMGIYNCGQYLSESIESILNQTYSDWELIMCEDGSKDNTIDIAKKYQMKYPEKIVLLENEKNMGLNYTLNRCLAIAKGVYIARQDGDDISYENRLEEEVNFLDNNQQYGFVSTNIEFFDESGKWGKIYMPENPTEIDLMKNNILIHGACMVRKECYDAVDNYTVDKKLLRVEDYHLWYKLYKKKYRGYNIQKFLYAMRDDRNAYKRRNYKSRINEARVRKLIFKNLKIPFRYSIYVLRPIILGLLPENLYRILHRKKLNRRNK